MRTSKLKGAAIAAVAMIWASGAAAQNFVIDKAHTNIFFMVNHLGYSKMLGQFNEFDGAFNFDNDRVENSKVSVTIKTASVDTDHEARDKHLRSPDFFNAKEFPEMRFVSSKIERTGDKTGKISGDLTLLGVTKPVTLDVTFNSMRKHPLPQYKGVLTAGFSARTKVKRSDFGMKYALGGIGDEIAIMLEIEGAEKI